MLAIALSTALVLVHAPHDTTTVDFRAATVAVLDSGAVWSRESVGKATRVVIDRASFETVARSIGATDPTSADFVKRARAGAEEKAFDDVKVCVGTVKPRCTLPYGTAVVMAVRAKQSGDAAVLTIAIKWPYRELMDFVEYDATFAKGALVSVRQVRRT